MYGKNNLGIGTEEVMYGSLHMFLRGSITLLEQIDIITYQLGKPSEFTQHLKNCMNCQSELLIE